jgi:hypothetical protein
VGKLLEFQGLSRMTEFCLTRPGARPPSARY